MKITVLVRFQPGPERGESFIWSDSLPVEVAALEAARHFGMTGELPAEARFHGLKPSPWTFLSLDGSRMADPRMGLREAVIQLGTVLELFARPEPAQP